MTTAQAAAAPPAADAGPQPLCTTCAAPAPHVYTTYTSKSNIRLGVCTHCGAFIDPLIEAPVLLLLLDLVLLKPGVFLHLLFNRASAPLDAGGGVGAGAGGAAGTAEPQPAHLPYRARVRHDLAVLGAATLAADVGVRVLPLLQAPAGFADTAARVLLTLVATALELAAQHAATLALALAILYARGWWPRAAGEATRDGRQRSFVPELVPLVLLYTALFPLLLQLALSIWYAPPASIHEALPSASASVLPERVVAALPSAVAEGIKAAEDSVLAAWSGANRVWAGTRLLGGMSAGFGLRVLLPTRPWETTSIVIFGWVAAFLVSQWLQALLPGLG